MTDAIINALKDVTQRDAIEPIIRLCDQETQRAYLLQATQACVKEKQFNAFNCLASFLRHHFSQTDLSALDDYIVQCFQALPPDTWISHTFRHYPKDNRTALVNRLAKELDELALHPVIKELDKQKDLPLIETLYLSEATIVPLLPLLAYFDEETLASLLTRLKTQEPDPDAGIQFNKCNGILHELLKRSPNKIEETRVLFQGEHAHAFFSHFLETPNTLDKPHRFLIEALEQYTIDKRDTVLLQRLNTQLFNCLNNISTTDAIHLLQAYQQNLGFANISKFMIERLVTEPDAYQTLYPYLKQLDMCDLMSFLTDGPNLPTKVITALLSQVDNDMLPLLEILANKDPDNDNHVFKSLLHQFIANKYIADPSLPLAVFISKISDMSTPLFSDVIDDLFQNFNGSLRQLELVMILVEQLDDFTTHRSTILNYIKTASTHLLLSDASAKFSLADIPKPFLSFFRDPDNLIPKLLRQFLNKAGEDEYVLLVEHLLMNEKPQKMEDALTVFKTNISLCARFLTSHDLPPAIIALTLEKLDDSALVELFTLIPLDDDRPKPANYDQLIQFLCNKLKRPYSEDSIHNKLKNSLLTQPAFCSALLADPVCLQSLTDIPTDLSYLGLGLIKGALTSTHSKLEHRIIAVIEGMLRTTPLATSRHALMRRMSQNVLIHYQTDPKTLANLLYHLNACATEEQTICIAPFVKELEDALFHLVKSRDDDFTQSSLHTKIAMLPTHPELMNGVYSSVALDAAKETNFSRAAEQLEKIASDITHLNLGIWNLALLPELLKQSDINGPNWTSCAHIIKQKEITDSELTELVQGLTSTLFASDSPAALKRKTAEFIVNTVYTEKNMTTFSSSSIAEVMRHLPHTHKKEDSPRLFFHALINSFYQAETFTIQSVALWLKALLDNSENVTDETLQQLLDHSLLNTTKALSELYVHLDKNDAFTPACRGIILAKLHTRSEEDKKEFLQYCLPHDVYDLNQLSALTNEVNQLKSLLRFSFTGHDSRIVTALFERLSQAFNKELAYFTQNAATPGREKELTQTLHLLKSTLISVLNKNADWSTSLIDNRDFNDVLKQLIAWHDKDEEPLSSALMQWLVELPVTFTISLANKTTDFRSKESFLTLLGALLHDKQYASCLSKEKYQCLFQLLPDTQKTQLATQLLHTDPLPDWLYNHIEELSRALSPNALFLIYQSHSAELLFAKLILQKKKSYHTLPTNDLKHVLYSVNQNTHIDNLLRHVDDDIVPLFCQSIHELLVGDDLGAWLSSVNLYDETFIRLMNGTINKMTQASLNTLIHKTHGLGLVSSYQSKINAQINLYNGSFPIYRDGLLATYVKAFIHSPALLSDCSEETLYHLSTKIDIACVTESIQDNAQLLDDSEALTEFMGPFVHQAGPSKGEEGHYTASHHTDFLNIARWFLNLPLISAAYIQSKNHIALIQEKTLLLDEGSLPKEVMGKLSELNTLVSQHFDHRTVKKTYTNRHYEHVTNQLALLEEILEALNATQDACLSSLIQSCQSMHSQLTEAKNKHDRQLQILKDAGGNLHLLFSKNSHLATITKSYHAEDFPRTHGAKEAWIDCLSDAYQQMNVEYQQNVKGILNTVNASLSVYDEKKGELQDDRSQHVDPQQAFITSALSSRHVIKDETMIEKACHLLTASSLNDVLLDYQKKAEQYQETLAYYSRLKEIFLERSDIHDAVHFLYGFDLDSVRKDGFTLTTLEKLTHSASLANTLSLEHFLHFLLDAKKADIPPKALQRFLLPQSISTCSEDYWLIADIDKTIEAIHASDERYQSIYQHALSYSTHKSIRHAEQTLMNLGRLHHDIFSGQRLGWLLSSYAAPIDREHLDKKYLEIALVNLLKNCSYAKQAEIIRHIDKNLLAQLLEHCIHGLSSSNPERVVRSSHLLDVISAYGLRDDVDDTLTRIIQHSLSKDHFDMYQQKIRGIIGQFVKEGKAPSAFTRFTDKETTEATMDGIWIQRILVNAHIVAKLTPSDLRELVERYRMISKYLKRDEYTQWEDRAKHNIQKLKDLVRNHQTKLDEKLKPRFAKTKLSKSDHEDIVALREDINKYKQRLANLEDKKRRISKFKANDAIRELLRQLQDDIEVTAKDDETLANAAQAVFSEYLGLQLNQYKADIFSRTFSFIHTKMVGQGDLEAESSLLSRLANKYIPHPNFETKELISTQIKAPTSEGALLYDEAGQAIAKLDEDGLLVSNEISDAENFALLIDMPTTHAGMPLYDSKKNRVGFLDTHGKLSAETLFMAHTSAELFCYTPKEELSALNHCIPMLIRDVINKKELTYLYTEMHDPMIMLKDTNNAFGTAKSSWVVEHVQTELLSSEASLSVQDATSIVTHHSEEQFQDLMACFITAKSPNTMTLLKAYLSNEKKMHGLVRDDTKKDALFAILNKLQLNATATLQLRNYGFNHSEDQAVRQLLTAYLYTNALHVNDIVGEHLIDYIHSDHVPDSSEGFNDYVQQLSSSLLTQNMLSSLHEDVRVEIALTPSHYAQLSQSKFEALFKGMSQINEKDTYRYFLTHNHSRLFFDKGISLFLRHNPERFYTVLSTITPTSLRDEISSRLLTHHECVQAVYEKQGEKPHWLAGAAQTLSRYFTHNKTSFDTLISMKAFMAGIRAYTSGYNTSPELASILSDLLYTRLNDFLASSPSETDIKSIASLADDENFALLHKQFPLCQSLFSQLVERAANNAITSLFYTSKGAFVIAHAKRSIKCALLGDLYSQMSIKDVSGKSWNVLKKLPWHKVKDKLGGTFKSLVWHNSDVSPSDTWDTLRQEAWGNVERMSENIKAIDLYLLNYQGDKSPLKTLLNDYFFSFYKKGSNFIPQAQNIIDELHSTAALLHNEHISHTVKAVIYELFEEHPRLRDKTIIESMAKYNLKKVLRYHGKKAQYDEILEIEMKNPSFTSSQNRTILKTACNEARLEKNLSALSGWFKDLRVWWKRITTYGFHGLFRPNAPEYVTPFSIKVDDLEMVRLTPSTYDFRQRLNSEKERSTHLIADLKREIDTFSSSDRKLSYEDTLDMLEHLQSFTFTHLSSVEDELSLRENLNIFFKMARDQRQDIIATHQDAESIFRQYAPMAAQNRMRLAELYTYQKENGLPHAREKLEQLRAECKEIKKTEMPTIHNAIIKDTATPYRPCAYEAREEQDELPSFTPLAIAV